MTVFKKDDFEFLSIAFGFSSFKKSSLK